MRAAVLHAYGPPENLVLEDVPEPALATPTDVRVRVRATSINPVEWKIRGGHQRGIVRLRMPWILGLDVSGEVLEVGPAVTRFRPGDEVYGCPTYKRPGAYAQQCVIDESFLAKKPAGLSHVEAATLPLVGLTAWQCLLPKLAERPGQRVLIQAGSGGVGAFAIQLAKVHGAHVLTTCSAANAELVRSLGADEVIDYRAARWWEVVSELDLVLESVSVEDRARALGVVKRGGRIASITAGVPEFTKRYGPLLGVAATGLSMAAWWLRGRLRGIDVENVLKVTRSDQLEAIARLVDEGRLRPVIDRTFPLEAIADAHRYGESGRIRGKVAIEVP